ncbi:MAG: rhomboid family intramembrane serine protease [Robiginitomaculum sp.]
MAARQPIFNFTEPAPVWLGAVLIAAHALMQFAPQELGNSFYNLAVLAARDGNVLLGRGGVGSFGSLALHGLLHADWGHVLINSAMIAVFGVLVCRAARGSGGATWRANGRFLTIFVLSIIAGGLAQWLWWALSHGTGQAVGASGGASGLFAAAAWVLGGKERVLKYGLGWIAVNILMAAGGFMGSQIAWAAHLGGYLGGALLALVFLRPNSTNFVITRR